MSTLIEIDDDDENTEMTLDDFESQLRRQVDNFFEIWRQNHEEQPEEYPLTMVSDESWMEQFLCDISNG